jgi:hypothetical protein
LDGTKPMKSTLRLHLLLSSVALLAACAAVAPQPWDRPVIVTKLGKALPESIVDACIDKAITAGLTPLLQGSTEQKVLRNQAYRNHVGKCILDQGYVILGWN